MGEVEADISYLRGLLGQMREPLLGVLSSDDRLDYPRCSWAASYICSAYLRDVGFEAEALPMVYVGGLLAGGSDVVHRLIGMPLLSREPTRLKSMFGDEIFSSLAACTHQSVGVRFRDDGRIRLFLVDFLLPLVFDSLEDRGDFICFEADVGSLLQSLNLVLVSPKFVRCPRGDCGMFEAVHEPVAIDLSDDYKRFKRMMDASRAK